MIDYVNADIQEHRKGKDRVGRDRLRPRRRHRNSAVRRRRASGAGDREHRRSRIHQSGRGDEARPGLFPEDAAKRIVIVSDGNQNLGNAVEQAQALAARGRGHRRAADPLSSPGRGHRRARGDSARRPPRPAVRPARGGHQHGAGRRPSDSGEVRGRLVLSRTAGDRTDVLERRAGRVAAGQEGLHDPAEDRRAEFLHLRSPLRPRPPGRRRHAAEQPGHGLHARAGQGPGAADRGRRAAAASSTCWSSGCGSRGWKSRCSRAASSSPTLAELQPLRHGGAGQRARASSSATSRSPCSCGTRSRWARAW